MRFVVAAVVILPPTFLVVGALIGRVRVSSCCSTADPAKDLRMRSAFDEDREHST